MCVLLLLKVDLEPRFVTGRLQSTIPFLSMQFSLITSALCSGVPAGVAYFLVRWLDRCSSSVKMILLGSLGLFLFFAAPFWLIYGLIGIAEFGPFELLSWKGGVCCVVLPLLGGYFHRRSGGSTRNWCCATFLSFLTFVLTVVIAFPFHAALLPCILLLVPIVQTIPLHAQVIDGDLVRNPWEIWYVVGLHVYPVLAPLLVLLWRLVRPDPESNQAAAPFNLESPQALS